MRKIILILISFIPNLILAQDIVFNLTDDLIELNKAYSEILQDPYTPIYENVANIKFKSSQALYDEIDQLKLTYNDSLRSLGITPPRILGHGEFTPNSGKNILDQQNDLLQKIIKITLEDDDDIKESESNTDLEKKVLIAELNRIFDPNNIDCPLPKKVFKKLIKNKNKGESWLPQYVKTVIKPLPKHAYSLQGQSIKRLTHTIMVKKANGDIKKTTLKQADSYKNFDLTKFLDTEFNSFIYTLDCSGYLNLSLSASGISPGADLSTKAESAVKSQNSMFIGGGVLVSPIASAYHEVLGIEFDTIQRLGILKPILNIPNLEDTDELLVPNNYEIVWASKEGSSSFNGKGQIKAKAGINAGVVRLSAQGNAGGSVSRESSFTSYETFIVRRNNPEEYPAFTVAQLKQLIQKLEGQN